MKKLFIILSILLPVAVFGQVAENFESGNIGAWTQSPAGRWQCTAEQAIEGNLSLKHIFDNSAAATDKISLEVNNINIGAGTTVWRFAVKHGYNPSASNNWAVFLMSDKNAENMQTANGYAVGVNLIGSNDLLRLFKITGGTASEIMATDLNWEKSIKTSGTAAIEVSRTASGTWTLRVDTTATFNDFKPRGTAIIDNNFTDFSNFGIAYSYTASADQKLWFDRLTITSSVLPAQIVSVEKISKTQISIYLSKSIQNAGNITLTDENGNAVTVSSTNIEGQNSDKILLNTETLKGCKFTVAISNLVDTDGVAANLSKTFFIDNYVFGDIVFNEIMFRPEPIVGLPNRKYIEIYNRTNYSVNLSGWQILYGDSGVAKIASDSVNSKSYAILCVSTAADDLKTYGKVITATSFPSLTYSGQSLRLVDADGVLISRVDYLPDWHSDTAKMAGGWALEKIDFDNLTEHADNWKSSSDASGGTPGRANSVQAQNSDNNPPTLVSSQIVDSNKFQLIFDEPLNEDIASQTYIYSVDENLGQPVKVTVNYNSVLLEFGGSIETGTIYTLTVLQQFADAAGNTLPQNLEVVFGIMPKPQPLDIVINEVLFNPREGGVDFVEIYNRSDKNFDLKDVYLAERDNAASALKATYQTSLKTRILKPAQFAVLTTNSEILQNQYFVADKDMIAEMAKIPVYPNGNGHVLIVNENNVDIDEFYYDEKMHFAHLSDYKGVSLERKSYNAPTNDASNWHSASSDVGYATPTYKNSQVDIIDEDFGFTISPTTFSPDGDGYNDELFINYKLPESGNVANITIFDAQGRIVNHLQRNATLGTEGQFVWSGNGERHQQMNAGIYIVYIEYFDFNGNITRIKKTCVLAKRK